MRNRRLKKLKDQVIVITGASSGIGLATARMAARHGARVVLAARNRGDLKLVTDEINANGGRAIAVETDVADEAAVTRLGEAALLEFGTVDTWVNNAGLSIYGKLTAIPLADKRKLFDINFWGVVHGCRTAVRLMRTGVLINIGSEVSDVAIPLQGMYSASKHAVKGYTDALRMELEKDGVPIFVSLVKPASIDTPFIAHARSYMEDEPEFIPPVYPPEEAARAILNCAERPVRDVLVGGATKNLDSSDGPQRDGQRGGATTRHAMNRSAYTRFATSRAGRALPFLAASALAAGLAFGLPPFAFTRRERHEDGGEA